VIVVLPASGWEMMAKVRREATSAATCSDRLMASTARVKNEARLYGLEESLSDLKILGAHLTGAAHGEASGHLGVVLGDLPVQRPQVIEPAQQEEAARAEPEDAGHPFTQIKAVYTEDAKKGE